MSFTPRIFGLVESEVLRGLEFAVSFDMEEEGRTGWLGSSQARGRLRIAVINRSGVTIRPLKGVLAPADGVEFRLTPFRVDELPAFREARLATIEATISSPAASLQTWVTVSLSGGVDLGQFHFQQAGRTVQRTGRSGMATARRVVGQGIGAIPLSEES